MFYIGFDIGGTNMKSAMISPNGEIEGQYSIKTPNEIVSFYEGLQHSVYRLTEKAGCSLNEIKGIGLGIPGSVDNEGVVYRFVNLGIEKEPLVKRIQGIYPHIKIKAANDAYVAALAEFNFGALSDCYNGVLFTLGTGVGSAFVVKKELYSSENGYNPELGHMIIGENLFDCNCGNNGCFETFCSATGLTKYTQHLLDEGMPSSLRGEHLNPQSIFKAYHSGDGLAVRSVERFLHYLSVGMVNVYNMLLPDTIVIGGGMSKGTDYFIPLLEEKTNAMIFNKMNGQVKIRRAKFDNGAGVIGAALLTMVE